MQTPTKGGGSNELTKKQATHNCTRKTADTLKTCVSMKESIDKKVDNTDKYLTHLCLS